MPASDPQPTARPGFLRRLFSADGAVLAVLVLGITVAVTLGGLAATNHFGLSAEIRGTHARIDETNARIDETNARIDQTNTQINTLNTSLTAQINTLNTSLTARIDQTNARLDTLQTEMGGLRTDITRLFALLDGTLREHSRRLDAIEQQLADRPAPSDGTVTP
ncbi:MAG: hypothetical protein OXF33_07710 [Rhodospirillales bacterium]|nr:hypothetical protein [Rhodospirillales bacterium]